MNASRTMVFAVVMSALVSGCGGEELAGPPELRPGRDECVECGMLINEDRCCAAMLLERGGRREHVLFDDLGCMLDYVVPGDDGAKVLERYGRDYESRAWVVCGDAFFLCTTPRSIATPMGSGLVAFADRAAAERAREQFGGEVADYARLVAVRREWLTEHHGKAE